jgi:hypothetical protein
MLLLISRCIPSFSFNVGFFCLYPTDSNKILLPAIPPSIALIVGSFLRIIFTDLFVSPTDSRFDIVKAIKLAT